MRLITIVLVLCICGACTNDNASIEDPITDADIDYSRLSYAHATGRQLASAADKSNFAEVVKNGIRLRLERQQGLIDFDEPNLDFSATSEAALSGGFSDTNVHVPGVDEADYVKYDGDYIYIAEKNGSIAGDAIRIMQTDPQQATATQLARIQINTDDFWQTELYSVVSDDQQQRSLLRMSHRLNDYIHFHLNPMESVDTIRTEREFFNYFPTDPKLDLALYDVIDPEDPYLQWQLEVDGYKVASRKVGKMLYLLIQGTPQIKGLVYGASEKDDRIKNERLIRDTAIETILPHYRIKDEDKSRPLVSPESCFVSSQVKSDEGFPYILTLAAFDLLEQRMVSSSCLLAHGFGIYSSPSAFYILGNEYEQSIDSNTVSISLRELTVLHKFSISESAVSFIASGEVPGTFIGPSNSSFHMDEYQGDMRIVTTQYENGGPKHQLFILREKSDAISANKQLQVIGKLPNKSNPAPLGKPGEEIYAVRFHGKRAYVVTFQQIDPLYVLDLSNSEDPFIAGELEVPGFAKYLHPVSDDWLLSIGREIINATEFGGIKVELFDVKDMNNPISVDRYVIGSKGSWSEALSDLHSISFLQSSDEQLRFTLPVVAYQPQSAGLSHRGLYQFEINGLQTSNARLQQNPPIILEQTNNSNNYLLYADDVRSILHDDAVYAIFDNKLWSAFWNGPLVSESL